MWGGANDTQKIFRFTFSQKITSSQKRIKGHITTTVIMKLNYSVFIKSNFWTANKTTCKT